MKQREKLGSRLGFILLSAGCAIGLGNVYRFPIFAGGYGGAVFVLIYIAFLILLGLPCMTAELAVGRAAQRSIATSFDELERPGQKWHWMKYLGIAGNYLLMMFYTCISGWMVIYFYQVSGRLHPLGARRCRSRCRIWRYGGQRLDHTQRNTRRYCYLLFDLLPRTSKRG